MAENATNIQLQEARERAEQRYINIQNNIDTESAALEQCKNDKSQYEATIEDLEKQLQAKEEEKENLPEMERIKELEKEIENDKNTINFRKNELADLYKKRNSIIPPNPFGGPNLGYVPRFGDKKKIQEIDAQIADHQKLIEGGEKRLATKEEELKTLQKELYNKIDNEIKTLQDKQIENQKNLQSAEECIAKNEKALSSSQAELSGLGYTLDDLSSFAAAYEQIDFSETNSLQLKRLSQTLSGSDFKFETLSDLRNLPNGINFRANTQITVDKVSNGNSQTSKNFIISKSYYMNKDYLFTNSLASPIPLGTVDRKIFPEIQTLIVNEFQPYDMLSLADMLPGFVDSAVGSVFKIMNFARSISCQYRKIIFNKF